MIHCKPLILVFLFSLCGQIFGQQSINSGAFQNAGYSFSIGQSFVSDIRSNSLSFQEGVQQVFDQAQVTFLNPSQEIEFEAFPIPARQELNIRLKGKTEQGFGLKLLDLSGRLIAVSSVNQKSTILNLSGFASGCYLLEIESSGARTVKMFMKK